MLIESIEKCKTDTCRLMYLRAMGNAGLPSFVPPIMYHAITSNNSMVSITAIEALRRVPKKLLDAGVGLCINNFPFFK